MVSLVRRFPFTAALILVLALVYVVEVVQSSPSFWLLGQGDLPDIAAAGVVSTPAIANGEVWRLVTAAFLHAGLLHLAMNVYVLVIIGTSAEARFGFWKTPLIFLLAVVGGNLAATYFQQDGVSLGASGGVMGLAGAVVVGAYRSGDGLARSQWVLSAIVITLAFGFVNPGISNAAHIGGLVAGALVALPMGVGRGSGRGRMARTRPRPRQQQPVNKRQVEFQRRIDEAQRKAAEERAREQLGTSGPGRGEGD